MLFHIRVDSDYSIDINDSNNKLLNSLISKFPARDVELFIARAKKRTLKSVAAEFNISQQRAGVICQTIQRHIYRTRWCQIAHFLHRFPKPWTIRYDDLLFVDSAGETIPLPELEDYIQLLEQEYQTAN